MQGKDFVIVEMVMFISPGLELLDLEHFKFICIYIKYHIIFKTLDITF